MSASRNFSDRISILNPLQLRIGDVREGDAHGRFIPTLLHAAISMQTRPAASNAHSLSAYDEPRSTHKSQSETFTRQKRGFSIPLTVAMSIDGTLTASIVASLAITVGVSVLSIQLIKSTLNCTV